MRASGLLVAGLMVSKYSPSAGSRHSPPMKCPKVRPRSSSQRTAGEALSGAGPYSMVSKISAMLMGAAGC